MTFLVFVIIYNVGTKVELIFYEIYQNIFQVYKKQSIENPQIIFNWKENMIFVNNNKIILLGFPVQRIQNYQLNQKCVSLITHVLRVLQIIFYQMFTITILKINMFCDASNNSDDIRFATYLVDNNIMKYALFSPRVWAESSNSILCITNIVVKHFTCNLFLCSIQGISIYLYLLKSKNQ